MTNQEWLTRCAARLRRYIGAEMSDYDIAELAKECLANVDCDTSEIPEDTADTEIYDGQ